MKPAQPRLSAGIALFLVALLLPACGDHRTPEQKAQAYRDQARQAREEAKSAQAKPDAKAARKAADSAAVAVKQIEKILPAYTPEIVQSYIGAKQFAAEANEVAALAEEQAYLADRLASWKLRSYRAGRSLALRGVCEGLALAADAAVKAPMASLPEPVQKSALFAADLDKSLTGRVPLPSGAPNWPAIAGDLRGIGAAPPPVLNDFLAVGYLLSANDDLALAEIEAVDSAKLPDATARGLHHILRGITYRLHNLPRLAQREFEAATAEGLRDDPMPAEYQGLLHLYLAYEHLSKKEYTKADLEAARAMRAWPNNPLAVFLTGERLLADGKPEQAAESLEAAVAGTKYDWLAAAVAQRAREIRDSKGPAKPLVSDSAFMAKLMLYTLTRSAAESAPAKTLQQWSTSAQEFIQRLVPGGAATVPASSSPATAP